MTPASMRNMLSSQKVPSETPRSQSSKTNNDDAPFSSNLPGHVAGSSGVIDTAQAISAPDMTDDETGRAHDREKLRDIINAQLDLEVLLKHEELRLIDQELAKCNVSLEQLRRCSEIPFSHSNMYERNDPTLVGTSSRTPHETMSHLPLQTSPASWRVTDGPYSRHYARWLLPDPRFEGEMPTDSPATMRESTMPFPDSNQITTRRKASKPSAVSRVQHGREASAPIPKVHPNQLILKRKSDGKWVKIACPECKRETFTTMQGFINHCRITHDIVYPSHEAAASATGEPIEMTEVDQDAATRTPSNPVSGSSSTGRNAIREVQDGSPSGDSNHIIREPFRTPPPSSDPMMASSTPRLKRKNNRRDDHSMQVVPADTGTPSTRHLSDMMERRGFSPFLDSMDDVIKSELPPAIAEDDDSLGTDRKVQDRPQNSPQRGKLPDQISLSKRKKSSGFENAMRN